MASRDDTQSLDKLRAQIDRIDEAMHKLLMERGEVIEALIEAKKSTETGAAFRPAREASMTHDLMRRHHGNLPLETAVYIWRIIMSTFTYLQSPYRVFAEEADKPSMRDILRAMYGFTVPIETCLDASSVVRTIALNPADLGVISFKAQSPWWQALEQEQSPKIVAILPDLVTFDGKAPPSGFVIASPDVPTKALPWRYVSVQLEHFQGHAPSRTILSHDQALLMEWPREMNDSEIINVLKQGNLTVAQICTVGYADKLWPETAQNKTERPS
jgi:chorismate mutase